MEAFPIADGKRTIRHLRSMVAISKTKNRDDTNSVTDCGLRLPDSGSMRYFIARVSRAPVEQSTTNAMLSIHGTALHLDHQLGHADAFLAKATCWWIR